MKRAGTGVADSEKENPGYVDLQVNGYVGVDFNDPDVTLEQIRSAAQAMSEDGVAAALPTVITAAPEAMVACISQLASAMETCDTVAAVFRGIHVEGPFLSKQPGFIGAHPPQDASGQDLKLLDKLLAAGRDRVRLLTLAPEIDAGGAMTRHCAESGVCVAAGHTNASLDELSCCIDAGLSLFTHLGNGCPNQLHRHENIILRGLLVSDRIHISVIADGHHIPETLFRLYLRIVPRQHLIVVSDAISAAGLGPGTYQLGSRQVKIGEDRVARDPVGEHFVGSASRMCDADRWLEETMQLDSDLRRELTAHNPARFLALSR
jgi:N-acetylglucosamine-6-phosphate deacetylase